MTDRVACPRCGARPGETCRTPKGRPIFHGHRGSAEHRARRALMFASSFKGLRRDFLAAHLQSYHGIPSGAADVLAMLMFEGPLPHGQTTIHAGSAWALLKRRLVYVDDDKLLQLDKEGHRLAQLYHVVVGTDPVAMICHFAAQLPEPEGPVLLDYVEQLTGRRGPAPFSPRKRKP